MFVDVLSSDEKVGLVKLLTVIAKADGNISKEERDFLSSYSTMHGVTVDFDLDCRLNDACSLLKTHKAKIVAMQEIVKMALVDGQYDTSERSGALAIAKQLSLSQESFEEIENWVFEGQRWVQKGEEMLEA